MALAEAISVHHPTEKVDGLLTGLQGLLLGAGEHSTATQLHPGPYLLSPGNFDGLLPKPSR